MRTITLMTQAGLVLRREAIPHSETDPLPRIIVDGAILFRLVDPVTARYEHARPFILGIHDGSNPEQFA